MLTERAKEMATLFSAMTIKELEVSLQNAESREERALFRALLNLKIQLRQAEIVGEVLV